MYVCLCHGVRDRDLKREIAAGCQRFEDLQAKTGVATCCGKCEPFARELVDSAVNDGAHGAQAA